MLQRNDLLPQGAPHSLAVFQLTKGPAPASHLYMEAQVFTPDSRHLLLHESATAHGARKDDPHHRYLLCDLRDHGKLTPVTHECGTTAPSVSPDGRTIYYFVDQTERSGGRLLLKRVGLDGTDRQTLLVLDTPLPGTPFHPSRLYPLSTIRSDGKKIALSSFLGNGTPESLRWGLMVFDLDGGGVELVLSGPTWCNCHPQYCRSMETGQRENLLVQENHGNRAAPDGHIHKLISGPGADIHVIRDDGSEFRNMPWGRDGNEQCQGHQCWRGRSAWAITSTVTKTPPERQLIESRAVPHEEHNGAASAGGVRNALSRSFPAACFSHFATDAAGHRLVTDTSSADPEGRVLIAGLQTPGTDAARDWTCIACSRSSWKKEAHVHPFLSPDGTMSFFNSDESGSLQTYMVNGLPF